MGSLVKVELKDGTACQVGHESLDVLLMRNEVARFKRSDEWAVVGLDSLRVKGRGMVYSVPERRN
jgi:hypothetical protein